MLSWKVAGEAFSEFTYAFALTNELVSIGNPPILSVPIFPSLVEEGRGAGYDVKLDRPGKPIFIQFKLSRLIRGRRAIEFRSREFWAPFYRMAIRQRRRSRQHEMLIELEQQNSGGVYYYAPAFHTLADLNRYYERREVEARSRRVKPSELWVPEDDREHWLSFQDPRGGFTALHSEESIPIELDNRPTELVLREHLKLLPEELALGHVLESLSRWMLESQLYSFEEFEPSVPAGRRSPLNVVALTAQLAFGCTLFVLQERRS